MSALQKLLGLNAREGILRISTRRVRLAAIAPGRVSMPARRVRPVNDWLRLR